MPLSTPSERKLAHTRVVTCRGFERQDKLWDIEGRIVDTKPYAFPNQDRGGEIKADEPLHDMSIRLTIDIDLKVHDAEAVIDDSPYHYCKCVTPIIKQLIGLRIAPGWTLKSKSAMGKNRGCTHLTELLGPIATTAIQTISSKKSARDANSESQRVKTPSAFIDSCHALAADSPVVKQHWPDQYRENSGDETIA
ncbi:hypothetical protein MnTg03_00559 [bacterium MnTg03]|nr:hypothetical protein MnTg03_00559 [bacterium MnTg03]